MLPLAPGNKKGDRASNAEACMWGAEMVAPYPIVCGASYDVEYGAKNIQEY